MPADLRLAIDIGGTFTDTVLAGADGTILSTAKTATTPDDPSQGALAGARLVLADAAAGFGVANAGGRQVVEQPRQRHIDGNLENRRLSHKSSI